MPGTEFALFAVRQFTRDSAIGKVAVVAAVRLAARTRRILTQPHGRGRERRLASPVLVVEPSMRRDRPAGEQMDVPRMGLTFAALAFAVDQGSKALTLNVLPLQGQGVEVLPVLNLVLVHNEGVSFGMLGGLTPWWALTLLATGIVVVLLIWLWQTRSRLVGASLGLLIGGALGNVLDRLRHGAVTDFLDFHLGGYHWPAFNLADVAVVSGAVVLVFSRKRGV